MKNYFYVFYFLLVISGCYKDSDKIITKKETVVEIPEVFFDTKISGYVLDDNGDRISNYSLVINEETFDVSSEYFLISLKNAKQRQSIFIQKDGDAIGIATVLLVENDINRLELNTFSKAQLYQPNHDLQVETDIFSLDFSNVKFVDLNKKFNVLISLFKDQIQVSSIGFSKLGKLKAIQPYQIFALHFKNKDGNNLMLQKDDLVNLSFKSISNSWVLLHFDQDREIWTETTDINSNQFETQIHSDGYYMLAKAQNGVFVKGEIQKNNISLAYHHLKWESESSFGNYYSTVNGKWLTLLPTNQDVDLKLVDNCGDILDINSFSTKISDIHINPINVDDAKSALLDADVIGCDGKLLPTPNIEFNNQTLYSFDGANIQAWLPECGDEIHLSAVDLDMNISGLDATLRDSKQILIGCDEIPVDYSYIKIRDDEKIVNVFEYHVENGKSIFLSQDNKIKLTLIGTGVGMYNENQIYISIDDETFGQHGYYIQCEGTEIGCGISDCKITPKTIGNGWVNLKFSGVLWMQTINPPVAGNFKIEGVISANVN